MMALVSFAQCSCTVTGRVGSVVAGAHASPQSCGVMSDHESIHNKVGPCKREVACIVEDTICSARVRSKGASICRPCRQAPCVSIGSKTGRRTDVEGQCAQGWRECLERYVLYVWVSCASRVGAKADFRAGRMLTVDSWTVCGWVRTFCFMLDVSVCSYGPNHLRTRQGIHVD